MNPLNPTTMAATGWVAYFDETSATVYKDVAPRTLPASESTNICREIFSSNVSAEFVAGGVTRTFGPKERNSELRRRFASTCRLRSAAETAAPAERARRMTKRRPRLAKRSRRRMRRNIERLAALLFIQTPPERLMLRKLGWWRWR